jgi:uncharacterized protein YjbJ (UPF0337 family)
MNSLQQLLSSFLAMSIAVVLTTIPVFGFGAADSWVVASLTQLNSQPQAEIATMSRAEKITKNIDGKAQGVIGNMTGDSKDQLNGKAKLAKREARNAAADVKDEAKLKKSAKAVTKNIEDKAKIARTR